MIKGAGSKNVAVTVFEGTVEDGLHVSVQHFKFHLTMVELCNVTNATIPGGTLSLMKTLKVPCSVELINVTSPPFWVALHNVKKCHHERVDEWSHT